MSMLPVPHKLAGPWNSQIKKSSHQEIVLRQKENLSKNSQTHGADHEAKLIY